MHTQVEAVPNSASWKQLYDQVVEKLSATPAGVQHSALRAEADQAWNKYSEELIKDSSIIRILVTQMASTLVAVDSGVVCTEHYDFR